MTRNQLKALAVVAMTLDHIAWAFVPTASPVGQLMHFFGRLTAPIMSFFIAEGYVHTRSVKKYALRLSLFALLSHPAFIYFEYGRLPVIRVSGRLLLIPVTGVIYTLFLGLLAIWLWDRGRCPRWCKMLGVAALCYLAQWGDWLCFTVLWCLCFFLFRDQPGKKWFAYCLVGLLSCLLVMGSEPLSSLHMLGVFVVPFLLQRCYNGQGGGQSPMGKWFFYAYYPLHLLALGILRWNIIG